MRESGEAAYRLCPSPLCPRLRAHAYARVAVGRGRGARRDARPTKKHRPPPPPPPRLLPHPFHPQVHKAVITETAKELRRPDGSALRFARNACVLLNAKRQPIGTRVLGFATHELRARGLMKVLSLTARVL